jgi:hypothetical protein
LVGQTIQILSTDQKKASARDDCAAPPVKRYMVPNIWTSCSVGGPVGYWSP